MKKNVCLKILIAVTGIMFCLGIIMESKYTKKYKGEDGEKPELDDLAEVIGIDGVSYCQHLSDSDIIVVVPSGSSNFDRRHFIRTTWGMSKIFAKILFMIGKTESDSVEQAIFEESKQLHDILRIDAPDNYKGLVFRLLSLYKWFSNTCHKGYIMKVDDDILIHPGRFIKSGIMDELSAVKNESVVYGRILGPGKTQRGGKWGLKKNEWPFDLLPVFANGFTYIMTQPALAAILNAFAREKYYIWSEDVYITGLLLKAGGGKLKEMEMFKSTYGEGGQYMPDIDSLKFLAQEDRDKMTGLVKLLPLKDFMSDITFLHVVDYTSSHPKGYELIREFIWGTIWEMDAGTRDLERAKLNFW